MVVQGGRVVEDGPRETLAADPASRYSQLLMAGAGDGIV
jgi:ABC-type microcin C transport system duplicated ATPase subunit YejF